MKVKELIKLLKKYPDFEVETSIFEKDKSEWGASLRSFSITGITDIGYSEKIIILSINEYT